MSQEISMKSIYRTLFFVLTMASLHGCVIAPNKGTLLVQPPEIGVIDNVSVRISFPSIAELEKVAGGEKCILSDYKTGKYQEQFASSITRAFEKNSIKTDVSLVDRKEIGNFQSSKSDLVLLIAPLGMSRLTNLPCGTSWTFVAVSLHKKSINKKVWSSVYNDVDLYSFREKYDYAPYLISLRMINNWSKSGLTNLGKSSATTPDGDKLFIDFNSYLRQ